MTSFFDKLNLRPGERRLVVAVALVVFLLINIWFVRPHFADWQKTKNEIALAKDSLSKAEKKIAMSKAPDGYEAQLKKLAGDSGEIAADEQEIQLLRTVMNYVAESKLHVNSYGPVTRSASTQTNEFFEEQSMKINFAAAENELVDFLVGIGSGNSMIRVRDLDLRPLDQARQKLAGNIVLIASYQKKTASAPKAVTPAAKTNLSGSKPLPKPALRTTNSPSPKQTNAPVTRQTNAPVTRPATPPLAPKKS